VNVKYINVKITVFSHSHILSFAYSIIKLHKGTLFEGDFVLHLIFAKFVVYERREKKVYLFTINSTGVIVCNVDN